ncbi:hypothetical protein AAP_03648 [Ascosphaera apis ARSEF 7405]|uniref:Uncharacterized protein n=1 Tax=Ascosphaera apis ARSEF 7405 TaxID=392613 RepID=A0A167Y935_9EURO|nr:hypothetical protein AAP_03648 [Ascosphaera apis ARSEF 7405]
MSDRQISYGRGGAGNIGSAKNAEHLDEKDLETPTLKSDIYTTGRGGSGNMVHNDDPKVARMRQDVEAPPSLLTNNEPDRKVLLGRGGAANHYSPTDEEANANALHKTTTATNQIAPDAAATEEAGESVQRPPMAHLHPQ